MKRYPQLAGDTYSNIVIWRWDAHKQEWRAELPDAVLHVKKMSRGRGVPCRWEAGISLIGAWPTETYFTMKITHMSRLSPDQAQDEALIYLRRAQKARERRSADSFNVQKMIVRTVETESGVFVVRVSCTHCKHKQTASSPVRLDTLNGLALHVCKPTRTP